MPLFHARERLTNPDQNVIMPEHFYESSAPFFATRRYLSQDHTYRYEESR